MAAYLNPGRLQQPFRKPEISLQVKQMRFACKYAVCSIFQALQDVKNRLFRDTAPALQKQNRFNKSESSTASGFLSLGPGDAIEGAWLEALRKDREALQKAPKPAQQVSRQLIYQLVEELNEDDRTQFLSKCW